MIDAPVGFAFAAGMVAAFNPCGFAMLPAYVSWFLGQESRVDRQPDPTTAVLAMRAFRVSVALTVGFAVVFLIAGALITQASVTVQRWTPWLTVIIGLALVPIGVATLAGWQPKVALPRLQRGGRGRDLRSIFWFGVSYATVSLSCTIPAFLVAVSGVLDRGGLVNGLVVFGAYAAGMGAVLSLLTVVLAVFNQRVAGRMRRILPIVPRVAGALLAVAGAYVAYYGFYEIQLERGRELPSGPVDWVGDASSSATQWIDDLGTTRIGLVAATVMAVVAVAWAFVRTRTDGATGADADSEFGSAERAAGGTIADVVLGDDRRGSES
ncbi:MAG: cytochrome c biogenesis CcdA family protein [Actinomycetota bacterium]|nr:cytochrome c biogenesis CcdA family protein [Actinomycetota bacterium]